MTTFPTEFSFRGETYARVRIDGRRHGKKCECCGYEVYPRVNDFACGRKVLHTSCIAKMLAAVSAPPAVEDHACAGCRRPLPASVKAAVFDGLRFCTYDCHRRVMVAVRHGVAS